MIYLVRLTMPRWGSWRAWGMAGGGFEQALAGQQDQAVTELRVDRQIRRGRDSVRIVIAATAEASDVAEALSLTWNATMRAAGEDAGGWDLAAASAEVQPVYPLAVPAPAEAAETARLACQAWYR